MAVPKSPRQGSSRLLITASGAGLGALVGALLGAGAPGGGGPALGPGQTPSGLCFDQANCRTTSTGEQECVGSDGRKYLVWPVPTAVIPGPGDRGQG